MPPVLVYEGPAGGRGQEVGRVPYVSVPSGTPGLQPQPPPRSSEGLILETPLPHLSSWTRRLCDVTRCPAAAPQRS